VVQVIGSDGGGIVITPHGIRRIPPWEPPMLWQLRALAALANAGSHLPAKVQGELAPLTDKLSELVVGQVEKATGETAKELEVIFEDEEGGIRCGNNLPHPLPIPPRPLGLTVSRLLAGRALEMERLQLGSSGGLRAVEQLDGD
jgi:hypothetical protein